MYVQIMTVTTNKLASEKTPTPSHTLREGDGDSARSTRAFRGVESASRKPAQNGYGEDRGEELGSNPATLRPLQNVIPFSIPLPLFYSPRREAVSISHITFILCPFR